MRDYIAINNYSGLGSIGISRHAIDTVAFIAVKNVQGAHIYVGKNRNRQLDDLFHLTGGVQTTISNNGKATIKLDIELKRGANAVEVSKAVQREVSDLVTLMCDTIPFDVKVRIAKVIA